MFGLYLTETMASISVFFLHHGVSEQKTSDQCGYKYAAPGRCETA
jgi:hypothetical protein